MQLKSSNGYTLIELLVVISVTAVLTGVMIVYNRSNERQLILYRDQATIIGIINRAKSLAIQKFQSPSFAGYNVCAFGVHFEPAPSKQFLIFGDLESGECISGRTYSYNSGSNPPELIEVFSLDPSLKFTGISEPIDILFIPPELSVKSNVSFPVNIAIQTVAGDSTAEISIGVAGQITTE